MKCCAKKAKLTFTIQMLLATLKATFTVHRLSLLQQEAQLSPSDRTMCLVSSNLANYHATVHKLLIRQVLTKPMV